MQTYANAQWPPGIRFEALPEDEHAHCHSINMELHALSTYITEFESSLALFEEVTARLRATYERTPLEDRGRLADIKQYHHWRKIAAQDCAMTIFHFGSAIEGIQVSLGKSKVIRSMMDETLKDKATSALAKNFPHLRQMRNGIAHAEEDHATDSKLKAKMSVGDPVSNAINRPRGLTHSWGKIGLGPTNGWLSGGSLTESTLSITNKNKMHSIEISNITVDKLHEVRELYYDAFFSVEENSQNARNAMYAANKVE